MWLGLRPVKSGAAWVFKSFMTLARSCSWKSDSFAPTRILVGADPGIRCCSAAAGCESTIFWLSSAVIIRGAERSWQIAVLNEFGDFVLGSCILLRCGHSVFKAVFFEFWYGLLQQIIKCLDRNSLARAAPPRVDDYVNSRSAALKLNLIVI